MGHRALVAYEQHDGNYSLHYSHWGAADLKLKRRITAETPFGGEDRDAAGAKRLFEELLEGIDPNDIGGYVADTDHVTAVEPHPMAVDVPREEVLGEYLDYLHHEAYYEVDSDLAVTPYRTLWFGLQYDSDAIDDGATVGNGTVVEVRFRDGEPVSDAFLRGQFRALKDVVGDCMIDQGSSERDTVRYMARKLEEWTGDHEELILAPAVRETVD
jgi:hypothetical protein